MSMERDQYFQKFILSSNYNKSIYSSYMKQKYTINEKNEQIMIEKLVSKQIKSSQAIYEKYEFLKDDTFYKNLKQEMQLIAGFGSEKLDFYHYLSQPKFKNKIFSALQQSATNKNFKITNFVNEEKGINQKISNDLNEIIKKMFNIFTELNTLEDSKNSQNIFGKKVKIINEGSVKSALTVYKEMIAGNNPKKQYNILLGQFYESLNTLAFYNALQKMKPEEKIRATIENIGGQGLRMDVLGSVLNESNQKELFAISQKATNPFGKEGQVLINLGGVSDIIKKESIDNIQDKNYEKYIVLSTLYYMSTNKNRQNDLINNIEFLSRFLALKYAGSLTGVLQKEMGGNISPNVLFIGLGNEMIKGYEFLEAIKKGFFEIFIGSFRYGITKTRYLPSNLYLSSVQILADSLKKDQISSSNNLYITNYMMQKQKTVQFIALKNANIKLKVKGSKIVKT